jgi:hypothetical protein
MVRSGHYNGIPLYTDTTVEPFTVVLVPISRGLLQPYRNLGRDVGPLMAAVPPTAPPMTVGAISVFTPESAVAFGSPQPAVEAREARAPLTDVVGTTGIAAPSRQTPVPVVSMLRPENNDGVWIVFGGERWISAGTAVPLVETDFVRVGEYAGFPVFARRDFTQEVIYLPSRAGLIAPYKLKNP